MAAVSQTLRGQWVVAGVVNAPVEDVWPALLDRALDLPAADKQAIVAAEASKPYTATLGKPGEGRIHIEVDKRQRRLTIEGEWWYRGITSVEPHHDGSLVLYRVVNIAPGLGWWVARLVQGPGHARAMKQHMQQLLGSIGSQLECTSHLLNTGMVRR